jgi:hypothetical protein
MTSPTKTGHGVAEIRWYHWAVYRLFRWFWNPLLRGSPGICRGLGKALLYYHDDQAVKEALADAERHTTTREAP